MNLEAIGNVLIEKGLKVTPQRIAIFMAVLKCNHPSADQVLEYIRTDNPNISLATVYKVLDTLVNKGLIHMVKTDKDVKRYDAVLEKHHHIYFSDSEIIKDYTDPELNKMIDQYFHKNPIPGLKIEDIKLQIIGRSAME